MCEPTNPSMPQSHVEIASKCRKRRSMFSVTNPFHLLVLVVQLGKEFERTAWYRADEIKKNSAKDRDSKERTSYGQKQTEERLIGGRMQSG